MTTATGPWLRRLPMAIAGPALVGAALGLPDGPAAVAARAALLPAIVLGVALIMLPALYIGAAFLGVAPSARSVVTAAGSALADTGTVFLGLAPALAFLVVASTRPASVELLGYLAVALAVVIGLRALYLRLFMERAARVVPLFACWAAVSVGIGARLLVEAIPPWA